MQNDSEALLLNRRAIGPAIGLLAVMALLFVSVTPASALSEYRLVNVTVRMVWTSTNSQASVVTVNTPTGVTISLTNEDSQSYTFAHCMFTIAAPSSAKFLTLTGFTCGVSEPFTLAGGATTSYTGPVTIPGPPTFPDGCTGGCSLVIAYVLIGNVQNPSTSTGYGDVESYPGYLIADLQPFAGTSFP